MEIFENFRDLVPDAEPADAGSVPGRGRQASLPLQPEPHAPVGNPSALAPELARERRARMASSPTAKTPDAHLSATAEEPKRDRQSSPAMQPIYGSPADHSKSASSSGRGRRAKYALSPIELASGGQLSDSLAQSGGLGDSGGAQCIGASQARFSPVAIEPSGSSDQPEAVGGGEGAHSRRATQCTCSPLTAEIVQLWRMRQRWHRAEKSLILQGRAICRAWTAGDKVEADRLFTAASKGEAADPTVEMALLPFLSAVDRFAKERAGIEKRLRKLAQASRLWPWVSEVKGFGPLNLAAVIGEAGEIATYRNPSCLWKRMGLAVIDGGRQRRVTDADAALVHGYAPARRAVAYLLGDTLIKAGDSCRYRPVYAARREHTAITHPDWTKAHSHNDAARYMVKRVLRDLWSAARAL